MQLQICLLIENSTKEHNFEKIMDPRLDMYLRKCKPTYFSAVLDFDFATSKSGLWSSLDRLMLVDGPTC